MAIKDLDFKLMTEEDLEQVVPIMRRAFDDDAQKHLGQEKGGPPGYDDGEFFHTWLFPYPESVGYMVRTGDQVIGGIIVWILPEGHNILGTIFIDPDFQDQGIGGKTWQFIEDEHPQTKTWRLGTPAWAIKNHHFYQKCGFVQVDSDPLMTIEDDSLIFWKKVE